MISAHVDKQIMTVWLPKLLFFHYSQAVVHLTWKKGVCCGRVALGYHFSAKTTLSLMTRKRLLNFAMLLSIISANIADIQYISNICSWTECS